MAEVFIARGKKKKMARLITAIKIFMIKWKLYGP